jgi:predicted nucleotidyltransferase
VLVLRQKSPEAEGDHFRQVLGEVGSILEKAGIAHALIGGIASSVLGRPRSTSDIDVFVKPSDADRALAELGAYGYETDRLDEAWIFKATKNGIQVDLIFYTRYGIFLDDVMLSRTRLASFRGARVRVVSPEDLLIMKAVAHDEATPRHWHDALGLIARAEIDWDYLLSRSTCAQRRVFSLILYAQSLDYWIPGHVISTLAQRVVEG